ASRYTLRERDGALFVDDVQLVFYHFQSLGLFAKDGPLLRFAGADQARPVPNSELVWTAAYPLSGEEVKLVWEPYVTQVAVMMERVKAVAPNFDAGVLTGQTVARKRLRPHLGSTARALFHRVPWLA